MIYPTLRLKQREKHVNRAYGGSRCAMLASNEVVGKSLFQDVSGLLYNDILTAPISCIIPTISIRGPPFDLG